jgi:DNA repair exonuclease SbcCD ATPase subunit
MATDTRQESDLQAAEFLRYIAECRTHVQTLLADVASTRASLDELEQQSDTLRSKATERLQALQQSVAGLRARLQDGLQTLDGRSQGLLERAQEAGRGLEARVEQSIGRSAELRTRLENGRQTIDGHLRQTAQRAAALTQALEALARRAQASAEQALQVCDAQVHAESRERAALLDAEQRSFGDSFETNLHDLVEVRIQALRARNAQTIDTFASQLGQTSNRLQGALERLAADFQRMQAQGQAELRRVHEQTDRAVRSISDLFVSTTDGMLDATSDLTEALESTNVGLKVTVGTLEKVRDAFEQIRL